MPINELITSKTADIARKNRLFPETPEELKVLRIAIASIWYDILSDILKNLFYIKKAVYNSVYLGRFFGKGKMVGALYDAKTCIGNKPLDNTSA